MENIAAVVVTYNRKELLYHNLISLINQTEKLDAIILVDNGCTDGTKSYLEKKGIIDNEKIKYIRLEDNLGGSGGFYYGLKYAYDNNFEWIWGMDDDAIPYDNSVEKLKQSICEYSNIKAFWSNVVHIKNDNPKKYFDIKEANSWMFVGFAINKEIIQKVGLPRKDFFIYHDDSEYFKRIRENGYKIMISGQSLVYHKDWTNRNFKTKSLIFKDLKLAEQKGWRTYYRIRNGLLMYSYFDKRKYYNLYLSFKDLIKYIIFKKNDNIKFTLKGLFHGLLGISGKKVEPF